jgi:hypothetical protein
MALVWLAAKIDLDPLYERCTVRVFPQKYTLDDGH